MKPAPFAYRDPDTVDEVLGLLAEHGDDAKLLAGGQSLGPMLNMRVVTPAVIVDLNRVRALGARGLSAGAGFALGALVRQAELEDDPGFAASQPLAAAALPWIAHRPIRNRGTVAGSLVHADPAAEWGGIVLALDARLVVRRAGAPPRAVAAEDFFTGILETAVEPEELLAEVRLPPWPEGARWGFREFARRRGDFALAGVACRFETDGAGGGCRSVRIGLFGVGVGAGVPMEGPAKYRHQREVLIAHEVVQPDCRQLDGVLGKVVKFLIESLRTDSIGKSINDVGVSLQGAIGCRVVLYGGGQPTLGAVVVGAEYYYGLYVREVRLDATPQLGVS